MGDMGDLYRAWDEDKAETRKAKQAEATAAIDVVRAGVDTLTVDPNGTWNIVKGKHKIQFYPTKGSWQYRGQMFYGGLHSFQGWLGKLPNSQVGSSKDENSTK